MHRRAFLAGLTALAGPGAASAAGPSSAGSGRLFLQLPGLTANVRRSDGRRGVMMVDAGLNVPDSALRARAESLKPRIQAELFGQLQAYANGLRPGEPPNLDLLAARLQTVVDRLLGVRGARVLLGAVLIN